MACDKQRIFEENKPIAEGFWYVDDVMDFQFDIEDVDLAYNIYTNVSHSSEYNFYNLYYKYTLQDSTAKDIKSELVNINLFDPKTGVPLGKGLGDVFDHNQLILEDFEFEKPGKYKISFQQYMRTDSLPNIVFIGARVERALNE
jgi:gliding motility-associated lipoprotein GldH